MSYKKLGQFIEVIDERNKKLLNLPLLGVSVQKCFIPSIANTVGTDFTKYKILQRNQFTYIADTSRRGDKIGVALLKDYERALVSQAYTTFKIIDETELLPDYLMMWFSRPEFDRYARYHSIGSVREVFDWDNMCEVELPVPSIEEQQQIVAQYQTVADIIKVNNQICSTLEAAAQALYKHWFVDFEFPDENGMPYKSSGGKMIWNEELEKEIPNGWTVSCLNEILDFSDTRTNLMSLNKDTYISTENMLSNKRGVEAISTLPIGTKVTQFLKGDILLSNIRPYLKKIWMADRDGGCSNDVLCLRAKNSDYQIFALNILWNDVFFDYVMQGAKGTKMPRGDKNWIMNYQIILPTNTILQQFAERKKYVNEITKLKPLQNQKLFQLQSLLLTRLATVEKNQLEYA